MQLLAQRKVILIVQVTIPVEHQLSEEQQIIIINYPILMVDSALIVLQWTPGNLNIVKTAVHNYFKWWT